MVGHNILPEIGRLCLYYKKLTIFNNSDPVGGIWSLDAIDKFEEWTHVAQWKKLSAKINGYSIREKTRAKREGSPVPGVDLFDVNNENDIDIAQELVNHGFAVFKKDVDFKFSSRTTSNSNISVASSS